MVKAIDFFCGAGGLTRGLLDAGVNVQIGVDKDTRLKKTYEHNNEPSRFMCQDIKDVDIHSLREEANISVDDVVLYAACTPCQPFSTLNQMKGEDPRKNLLINFATLVQKIPPDFILVENVPGLNTSYGREIYDQFVAILKSCGFHEPSTAFLDAHDFGVPQVRKRFILLASRHSAVTLPLPDINNRPTVKTYLQRYPAILDGESSTKFLNHVARRLPSHHKRIVQAVPKNGGSRCDVEDTSVLLQCHKDNPKAHKDVFGRMSWDKPAPTLTCRCTDVYCGRFTHPEQDRGISLREAAALQTFPDDYEFFGTFFHMATQIGNAVPVSLAKHLGQSILNATQILGRVT